MGLSTLNKYSLSKIEQINAEFPVRLALIERAGGDPFIFQQEFTHGTGKHKRLLVINRVTCIGGRCEICGKRAPSLEPHEKFPRGKGGLLSLKNSKMVCRKCHNKEHKPRSPRLKWVR